MKRCTGHCCNGFTLPVGWADMIAGGWYDLGHELRTDAAAEVAVKLARKHIGGGWHGAPEDGYRIAQMVIPLLGDAAELARRSYRPGSVFGVEEGGPFFYRCRNLTAAGDCAIYDRRPRMCSGFPYGRPCPFEGCTYVPPPLDEAPTKLIELVAIDAPAGRC